MSKTESSGKTWIFWLATGIVFILALLVSLRFLGEPEIFEPTSIPVATFDTANGGELEILRVAVGKMEFGEARKPRGFFSFSTSNEGASGGTYGGVNFYTERKNEINTYLRLEGGSPDDLIVEVRLLDRSAEARKFSSYLNSNKIVSEDQRIAPSAPRDYHFYEPKGESIDKILDAMARCNLGILFQYQDTDSGWINMGGPGMAWEEWPDRYYLTLDSWQRNQTELNFRMVENDGSITEFHLANPDFKKSGIPLKPATLPILKTGKDFTLTVNRLTRTPFPGEQPFAVMDMEIIYTGPKVEGLPNGPIHFEGNENEASDEWGNVTSVVRETIGGKTTQGIRLPQNSKFASTVFKIQTTRDYPQDQGSGIPILEGTVNAAGTSIDFAKIRGASEFTKVFISNCKIGSPAHNSFPATKDKGWKELTFEIDCRADIKKYEKLKLRIGENTEWIPLVFIGEDTLSSGLGRARSGGHSSSEAEVSMKDGFSKIFPPQALQPGHKVRIAIHSSPEDEEVEIVLPLPAMLRSE